MSTTPIAQSVRTRLLSRCVGIALASCSLAPLRAEPMFVAHRDLLVPKWIERADQPSTATTVFVSNCNDDGSGSLREALLDAVGDTIIDLDDLTCSTITLTTGALSPPSAAGKITIEHSPAYLNGRRVPSLTIDANAAGRVIEDHFDHGLSLIGVTLQNATYTGNKGGCIYTYGPLYMDTVAVQYCRLIAPATTDALGGAIYSKSLINLNFSTVSHSSADAPTGYAYGGGIFSAYTLGLFYSTISDNQTQGGLGYGGGIAARGVLDMQLSLVANNSATYDGGLALFGGSTLPHSLFINGSTIAYNSALGNVGGIEASAKLYIYASTIASNNGGAGRAGGIQLDSSDGLALYGSIVAINQAGGMPSDIGGAGTVVGHRNIVIASTITLPGDTISSDPLLGHLGDHGGQTMIMPLLAGSPAIDPGDNYSTLICDQRAGNFSYYFGFVTRFPRVVGSGADIGAYEFGANDAIWHNGFDGQPALPSHCLVL